MAGELEACVSLAAADRGFFGAKKGNLHDQEIQEDPLAKSKTDQLLNTKKLAQVEYLRNEDDGRGLWLMMEIPNPSGPSGCVEEVHGRMEICKNDQLEQEHSYQGKTAFVRAVRNLIDTGATAQQSNTMLSFVPP
jgi:hypothetical protein